jgi:SAM-dependent methyltransferase
MDETAARAALDVLTGCTRYARWLYDLASPYIGSRVVEVGAGLGTQSALLVGASGGGGRELVLTDADPARVEALRSRFAGRERLAAETWRLPEPFGRTGFRPETILAWNVLEHVRDDVRALAEFRRALAPGGRAVVFSPAGPGLFSGLDRALGHHRRYARRELTRKALRAGLTPLLERRVNLVGAVGWLVTARFLGRRRIPAGRARLFNLLVPLLRFWEDRLPVPWGMSVLFVGERPAE